MAVQNEGLSKLGSEMLPYKMKTPEEGNFKIPLYKMRAFPARPASRIERVDAHKMRTPSGRKIYFLVFGDILMFLYLWQMAGAFIL